MDNAEEREYEMNKNICTLFSYIFVYIFEKIFITYFKRFKYRNNYINCGNLARKLIIINNITVIFNISCRVAEFLKIYPILKPIIKVRASRAAAQILDKRKWLNLLLANLS